MTQSTLVVGIGGSTRPTSMTSQLLHHAMSRIADLGAEVRTFDGAQLATLPIFTLDDGCTAAPNSRCAVQMMAIFASAATVCECEVEVVPPLADEVSSVMAAHPAVGAESTNARRRRTTPRISRSTS